MLYLPKKGVGNCRAMPATDEQSKTELATVLKSGLLAHAPGLAQFLEYVCGRCFEGQASQIKEYSIAVEALGRPPDFDQKKDSIVRVEAHRLRKRLRRYYEGEGAGHSVQIVIPAGQYVPQFVLQEDASTVLAQVAEIYEEVEAGSPPNGDIAVQPPQDLAGHDPPKNRWIWFGGIAVILAAILFVWQLAPQLRMVSPVAKAEGPQLPLFSGGEDREVRILVGSSASKYIDRFGSVWSGDRFFQGGSVFSTQPAYHIIGTQDPTLFHSRREGTFQYAIPLKPGTYELHLYFAETLFGEGNIAGGGETSRLFDIVVNGRTLNSYFDVIADAPGPNTADIKVYKDISPTPDGLLHLDFPPGTKEKAFLNAVEILPSIPSKLRPIRIVARDTSINSKDGRLWGADRYFVGGQRVLRRDPIQGTPDPELYLGERFGHFQYSIPVAPGKYTVTLRFCESWFGPGKPVGGGAGMRVFDLYCNGLALMRNFDIFKEAGGDNRPLDKVFHSLEPNAQGKLVLSFVPVRNYACINAIEVVDEGP